jgi:hypothetical protein
MPIKIKITKEEFVKLREHRIDSESDSEGYVYTTTYILPNQIEIQEEIVSTEHSEDGEMVIDQENYYLYIYMED